MHQNASECIEMHQNVWRMNNVNVLCMKFQFEKFWFFGQKMVIFFLSAQNASICIRMHQNVCRMNCANVLCMKLSKKLFLLHLNRLKLMNYLWLFVMEDPVFILSKLKPVHRDHVTRIYQNKTCWKEQHYSASIGIPLWSEISYKQIYKHAIVLRYPVFIDL